MGEKGKAKDLRVMKRPAVVRGAPVLSRGQPSSGKGGDWKRPYRHSWGKESSR